MILKKALEELSQRSKMINAANKIKSYSGINNLDFYVFNLDQEPLEFIYDFLPEDNIDVILFLSVCKWINSCEQVIKFSSELAEKLIFESNGTKEQQDNQESMLVKYFSKVEKISDSSDDDPLQKNRRLFVCYK
jgi:hypothetical protein